MYNTIEPGDSIEVINAKLQTEEYNNLSDDEIIEKLKEINAINTNKYTIRNHKVVEMI